MIANELRRPDGAFKLDKRDLSQKINKDIQKLYVKYKDKVSYDLLHLLICDASHRERIFKIAVESSKEK